MQPELCITDLRQAPRVRSDSVDGPRKRLQTSQIYHLRRTLLKQYELLLLEFPKDLIDVDARHTHCICKVDLPDGYRITKCGSNWSQARGQIGQ